MLALPGFKISGATYVNDTTCWRILEFERRFNPFKLDFENSNLTARKSAGIDASLSRLLTQDNSSISPGWRNLTIRERISE